MNRSIWVSSKINRYRRLHATTEVDVCVIGAGIAGVTSAYLLSKSGKSVALVDSGEVGNGATADTTAHLTCVLDERYHKIVEHKGKEKARLALESHNAAIGAIEKIITEEKIDCEFSRVPGYLFTNRQKNSDSYWDRELEALRSLGLTSIHSLSHAPMETAKTGPCVEIPHQAQFHPLRYLNGLCESIIGFGSKIYENTRVISVEEKDSVTVTTQDQCVVRARSVIIATNSPINNLITMHTKQAAYQSYVVALHVPRYSHAQALYWDDAEPYHYVRFASLADQDVLIVGGEDHKTGQKNDPEQRFDALEQWSREFFPQAGAVVRKWCGQVLEPIDDLAFIGHNPGNQNIYIATGFSGNGMTYGTISGLMFNAMIQGEQHPWQRIYNPSRIPVGAAGEFAKENLNVAAQLTDWVKGGEVDSQDNIEKGEGAVVRSGVKMLAVYKDDSGQTFSYSAKCPHLGCVVHWNSAAKTWDCPCHGSRFNCNGKVIAGPAVSDLEEQNDSTTHLLIRAKEANI